MQHVSYRKQKQIINEDYDKEEDDYKRMLMIVDEIDRLCHLNDDELRVFLNEAKKITQYNYNVLLNKKEFLTIL